MSGARTRFTVARVGWRVNAYSDEYTSIMPDFCAIAGAEDRRFVPVAALGERTTAEAQARGLELEAARLFNPFWLAAPFSHLSGVPEPEFRERLAALVGPLPPAPLSQQPRTEWQSWWEEHAPDWSDDALAAVWELFDAVRFYAVLEVEADDE